MKHAVVAGGAGFLRSHLCHALHQQGMQVWCVDNLQTGQRQTLADLENSPRFSFMEADIICPSFRDRLPPRLDLIFNLASAASPLHYQADPEHTLMTNVVGTRNLLHLAEACGARFLLTSTSEVYGDPEVHPQSEDYRGHVNCTGPRACYDEGKRAAETLTFDFDRAGRVTARVARLFNTYGPGMRAEDGRVVSNVIFQALNGLPITVYGDGSQTRSLCYVDDTIDGLLRLMDLDGPQPGPVNIGNPVEQSVSDLVRQVLILTGSLSRVTYLPLPVDDPRRRCPDITKAQRLLGWTPQRHVIEGLTATIHWFQQGQPANLHAAGIAA